MTTSTIAVVVTCFNLGRTLDEALESVLAQTRPADDVVVIDDGSTDLFTQQVLARLGRSGVRVFRTPNRGVSAARNVGARCTEASCLVFLDADDRLAPEYLATLGECLDGDEGLGFVSCGMTSFGAVSETWTPPHPELITSLTFGVVHVSSLMRRSVFDAVGGFDESFRAQEDLDFWTRVVAAGFRGVVVREPLFMYRVRSGSNYRHAVQKDVHQALMRRFYKKHREVLDPRAIDLLVAKERFILDQQAHHERLLVRQQELRRQLEQLQHDISDVREALSRRGDAGVRWGDMRRTTPFSPAWGLDRGTPLDRHYIHGFLHRHRLDIRGRVLEIKDAGYTRMFGDDRVESSDILDIDDSNEQATVIADLSRADAVPSDTYDCIILTQTLGLIFDAASAIRHVHRMLKPGGVVLCTLPASGRLSCESPELDGDFWRFTEASARAVFAGAFAPRDFDVAGFGNVLAASAFLYGLTPDELTPAELDAHDPYFPVVYGVRAVKAHSGAGGVDRRATTRRASAAVLMYHRVTDGADPTGLAVTPTHFEAHLDALQAEGVAVLPLAELSQRVAARTLEGPAVALTFDDGYADSLAVVAPMLVARHHSATFFVVTGMLGGGVEFWWDVVDRVFRGDRPLPSSLSLAELIPGLEMDFASEAARRAAKAQLVSQLITLPLSTRDRVVERIRRWSGMADFAGPRLLTADEVRELATLPGIDVGCHSAHHVWLPSQPFEVRREEIADSRDILGRVLGRPVTSFAYPYGGHDEETIALVRSAGFARAVTTAERAVESLHDPFAIPRIRAGNWPPDVIVARCRALWQHE